MRPGDEVQWRDPEEAAASADAPWRPGTITRVYYRVAIPEGGTVAPRLPLETP